LVALACGLLTLRMKALRLTRWGKPAELHEVTAPEPGPGQVVVKIAGAGACHSDLHLMDWPEGTLSWPLPFTLGHENAGWIEAIGQGVSAGELVVSGGGLGRDGGMAEYMLVPSARFIVPIGELDPVQAAPLADAALTPYHAIARSRDRLQPGSTTVVIGCGGLGQMAIQLLEATTATRIIAVDTDDRKLELARKLGVELAVHASANAAEVIRRATAGVGAELVLDMVGADATLALGAKALRSEGRLVIIGLALGKLSVGFFDLPYGAEGRPATGAPRRS
jgi:propanol-preferring alcohol dehydrogenase